MESYTQWQHNGIQKSRTEVFQMYSLQLLKFFKTVSKASSPFCASARNWSVCVDVKCELIYLLPIYKSPFPFLFHFFWYCITNLDAPDSETPPLGIKSHEIKRPFET